MQMKTTFLLLGAAIALGACASSPTYNGGRTWEAGWREGVIESVNGDLKWNQYASCKQVAAAGDKFVVVKYRTGNKPRWLFIPMAPKNAPASQAKVLVNVNSCELVPNA